MLKAKEARIKRLEEQAFYMISAEVRDIVYHGNENYDAMLRVDNVSDEPVYVSHPEVKAYVQTGSISWTEVPVQDRKSERKEQVYKIEREGRVPYFKVITINRSIPYNQNLMPKYMHVRLYISMYILPESGFKEGEVVERRSSNYIYLKPYYVSDGEIRKVIDFGDTKVPAFMPITAFRNWN